MNAPANSPSPIAAPAQPARPRGRRPGRCSRKVRLRRGVQLTGLLAFLVLLLLARPIPGEPPAGLLKLFFYLDPLLLVVTALAAHAVTLGALLALATLAFTIVLGRVFCGWICPFGTVHAAAGRIFDRFQKTRPPQHWSPWQLAKYLLLVALLAMALLGVSWLMLFDPLVILYRTTTTAFWPAAQWGLEHGTTALYHSDSGPGGWWRPTLVSEPLYRFARDHLFVKSDQAFLGTGLILGFFALLVGLNLVRRRFWCRYLCPLGALLGLLAWRPWLRRQTSAEQCNQCDLCGLPCHAAATSAPGAGWKPQECFACFNCTDACPRAGLGFVFAPPWKPAGPSIAARPQAERLDLARRHLLGAAALGLAGAALLRATPHGRGTAFHPDLIRPPGALPEDEFLARCTACGACLKICPTGGLQPTWREAGLAGLWTPRLVPRLGYCEHTCTRCGEICPTAAIQPLPLPQKQQTRIGLAVFDTARCLPYAFGRNCLVCEEHCPIPTKAIYFTEVAVRGRDGLPRTVKQPHVDPQLCTGCGICEYVCPFKDQPAIRVTSANESRHPRNQPILPLDSLGDSPYG